MDLLVHPQADFRLYRSVNRRDWTPFGPDPTSDGGFFFPTSLSLSEDSQRVAVTDFMNHRVVILNRAGQIVAEHRVPAPERVKPDRRGGWLVLHSGSMLGQRMPYDRFSISKITEVGTIRRIYEDTVGVTPLPRDRYDDRSGEFESAVRPALMSTWDFVQMQGGLIVLPVARSEPGTVCGYEQGYYAFPENPEGLAFLSVRRRIGGPPLLTWEKVKNDLEPMGIAIEGQSRKVLTLEWYSGGTASAPQVTLWDCALPRSTVQLRLSPTRKRLCARIRADPLGLLYPRLKEINEEHWGVNAMSRAMRQWEDSLQALRGYFGCLRPLAEPTNRVRLIPKHSAQASERLGPTSIRFPHPYLPRLGAAGEEYRLHSQGSVMARDRVYALPMYWKGKVYIGAGLWDRNVYALKADTGKEIWRFDTGWAVLAPVGINMEKPWLAAVNGEGGVFILEAETGEWLGQAKVDVGTTYAPYWVGDRLYIKDANEKVHAFDVVPAKTSPNTKASAQSGKK
jgi:hypothetical protein